jgi:hypothetical protein
LLLETDALFSPLQDFNDGVKYLIFVVFNDPPVVTEGTNTKIVILTLSSFEKNLRVFSE